MYSYLAQQWPDNDFDLEALGYIEDAISALAEVPMGPDLFGGFTGIAWAVEHLQMRLLEPDDEDANEAIDQALTELLSQSPWQKDYDLIVGLVGMGVYALERLPRDSAVTILKLIIQRLDEIAVHTSEGICWWTNPEWFPPEPRQSFPDGYYNLGLAHGVPGVIAFLGEVCSAGVSEDQARFLLDGAVRWQLSQRLPESSDSCFSYYSGFGIEPESSRSAWCYGDPGVAAALFYAARCVDNATWEEEALEIALKAIRRPAKDTGAIDAGLCHGAAGLGHIYNRLYQASGEEQLKAAAVFWFACTLEMRKPDEGIGGYTVLVPDEMNQHAWIAVPGLLEGAIGIALAMQAAISTIEPAWDRILLLSIPPEKK